MVNDIDMIKQQMNLAQQHRIVMPGNFVYWADYVSIKDFGQDNLITAIISRDKKGKKLKQPFTLICRQEYCGGIFDV